ncbi:50S ribosomal protein L11 [endosymbiont of Sipalinus gigas]|nr:50S ribosomal protein L11 [endosymbiont of Sipalinus gigas]
MKKIECNIKLQIPSQEANPGPPIGPILGQKGINILKFCNEFNNKSINIEKGLIVSVLINVFSDKTFNFIIKNSPTSILIKKILNISSGSKTPGKLFVSTINKKQIYNISLLKLNDSNSLKIESVINSITGTIKSMGIKIED